MRSPDENPHLYELCPYFTSGVRALPPENNPGIVQVEWEGIKSSVCYEDWNDTDASLYCQDLGYNYGFSFGM